MYRIAVDTGGTFSDVDPARRGGRAVAEQGADDARPGVPGDLGGTVAGRRGARALACGSCLPTRRSSSTGRRAATNAIITGRTARTAFLTTEGFPDTLVLREGGKLHPFDFGARVPEAVRPAPADVRGRRSASARRATCVVPAGRRAAVARRSRGCASSTSRRSPSRCCGRSSIRRTRRRSREVLERRAPGRPVHALASAQPDHPRVPARLVGGDRRVAQAADAAASPARCARRSARARASTGELLVVELVRRRARRSTTWRAGRSTPSTRARRWRPSPGGAYAARRDRQRDRRATRAGRASTSASIRDGYIQFTRETWLGGRLHGPHDRASRRST